MDFPAFLTPTVVNTIRKWFNVKVLITPYFDNDFNTEVRIYYQGTEACST